MFLAGGLSDEGHRLLQAHEVKGAAPALGEGQF
jgi:hypothetical protein